MLLFELRITVKGSFFIEWMNGAIGGVAVKEHCSTISLLDVAVLFVVYCLTHIYL